MTSDLQVNRKSVEVVKKIQEEVINLRWTIENFTESYEGAADGQYTLCSNDSFDLESNSFSLSLVCPDNDDETFVLFLGQYYEGRAMVDIECGNSWLEDIDGNKYCEAGVDSYDQQKGFFLEHNFTRTLQKRDLDTTIKLRDDVAIFCCDFKKRVPGKEIPKFAVELPQKLWASYQQGLIDSITIQVESKEIKVSKSILAANSDVFERMLLTPSCKEVQEGIIKISEVSFDAMNVFIEYLHRGQIENLPAVCNDLFVLSHRYMVTQLQEDCAKEMIKSLTKENLFGRLQLAFLYDQQNLKNAVLNYVTSSGSEMNVRQIMKSSEWYELASSNEVLANEITDAFFDKVQLFPEQKDEEVQNKRPKLE